MNTHTVVVVVTDTQVYYYIDNNRLSYVYWLLK